MEDNDNHNDQTMNNLFKARFLGELDQYKNIVDDMSFLHQHSKSKRKIIYIIDDKPQICFIHHVKHSFDGNHIVFLSLEEDTNDFDYIIPYSKIEHDLLGYTYIDDISDGNDLITRLDEFITLSLTVR